MEFEFDKTTVTLITILVICVFGLLGNFLCGIVIFAKHPKSPFYLLLIGLTFCDSLLLFKNLPNVLHHLKILSLDNSPKWLEITFYFMDWISFSGTKYYTVAVSLERYFIICHPMRAQNIVTHRNSVRFTIGVFVFVVLISVWSYVFEKLIDHKGTFQIYKAIILHVIPLVLILVLNVLLWIGLKKFQKNRRNLISSSNDAKEISVTKMVLAVVVVFTICSGVEFVRNIMAYAGYFDFINYKWYDYNINCISGILVVLNSAVNFIIYCLMGATFLDEFKKRVRSIWHCLSSKNKKNNNNGGKIIVSFSEGSKTTKGSSFSNSKSDA